MISYRTALVAMGAGVLYMGGWLYQAGLSLPLVVLLFAVCLIVFLVLNRVVSETGFAAAYSPINPTEFAVCAVGSSAFSPSGLVTLGFGYAWTMTRFNTVLPHAQGALRLVRGIARKRGLMWAMGAAMAAGLIATTYMTLKLGYTHGGLNSDRFFSVGAVLPFNGYIGSRMLQPSPVFKQGLVYTLIGVGIATVLTLLRTRFVWWPLHPVALPVSTIAYTDIYFFSVFLAWGIKELMLKFGGAKLYDATRPFFIGVIVGEAACAGMWVAIDSITGMTANNLSYW